MKRMDRIMGKFLVKTTATGIKFDLKAGNGETIATSEVYTTKQACLNGIASVKKNCVGGVEDQTVEPIVAVKHPTRRFNLRLLQKHCAKNRALCAFSPQTVTFYPFTTTGFPCIIHLTYSVKEI